MIVKKRSIFWDIYVLVEIVTQNIWKENLLEVQKSLTETYELSLVQLESLWFFCNILLLSYLHRGGYSAACMLDERFQNVP